MDPTTTLITGDAAAALRQLDAESVQCCVTSPPYLHLRCYGTDGQIGLEATPEEYVAKLVDVFREVRRVLKDDGVLFVVLGDSYARNPKKGQHKPGQTGRKQAYVYNRGGGRASATVIGNGIKEKDLIGVPWLVAFGLRADGWWLRNDVIWEKPNALCESVKDRFTQSHEYVFMLSKSKRYTFHRHREAAVGGGERNGRTVWRINTQPLKGSAHCATFPEALAAKCVLAGSEPGDTVLDPFCGIGTTGVVSRAAGRNFVGIDLNGTYTALARTRIGA
jgi:site-specific DNA-methyltransferase (cytosine-N4-specific)